MDGACRGNPGPASVGAVIRSATGSLLREVSERLGPTTNNVAEYTAVIVGLELAKKLGAGEVRYFVDSELVAYQLSGKYKIKAPHIKTLYNQVKAMEKFFKKVTFTQVPRTHEKLRYVDKLVNKALDQEGY